MDTGNTSEDVRTAQCDAFDYITSPSICVRVSTPESGFQDFFVHQSLICSRSHFFVKALSSSWKEAESRVVWLPEDEPEIVSLYIKLLYTDSLHLRESVTDVGEKPDPYLTLSKLYVLAEKLVDETTKPTVLRVLSARSGQCTSGGNHERPGLQSILTIYDGTPDGSEARKWLVDVYTNHVGQEASFNLFPHAKDFPREFLSDLVSSLITFRPLPKQLISAKDKLAQTEEQLKKKLSDLENTKKGLNTVAVQHRLAQNSKTALEHDLNEARAKVTTLKRRLESTETTCGRTFSDMYRKL